jgi:hypothetical protein
VLQVDGELPADLPADCLTHYGSRSDFKSLLGSSETVHSGPDLQLVLLARRPSVFR